MKKHEIKTELLINGSKVVFGHQFIEDIVGCIPDIKENQAIFSLLAKSDNPNVRESISSKDNLSKKTIHLLLDDESQEVVDTILSNSNSAKKINEDNLLKIIKSDNVKYLTTIAKNLEKYALCNIGKIAHILCNHKNASVRYSLVQYSTYYGIIKKLSKDKDFDVAKVAKEEL